jgi:predicted MPP superfamily phosphohydrolase
LPLFRLSKRTTIIGAALLVTLIASAIYAYFIEPYQIQVATYSLTDRQRPIRIAHLSDFHVEDENGLDRVRRAIAITKDQRPDLIVITGDFITDFVYRPEAYLDLLKEIPKIAPTFAIGGNHDGGFFGSSRICVGRSIAPAPLQCR